MNKKILSLQALILLPVSIASLWGGLAILYILIGDKLRSNTVIALLFIAIIVLCFSGLITLWVELISRLFFKRTFMNKRLVTIPMHICAAIAITSIFSLVSLLIVPGSKDTTGSLGLFAYGSPALFPYFYFVRTKIASNTMKLDS